MDEPLSKYLDLMIQSSYVHTERGVGRKIMNPPEEDIRALIEDQVWGRPVPIDDSADHYLLLSFDRVRREIFGRAMVGSERGFVRRLDGTYDSVAHTQPHPVVVGEIPWRSFHSLPKDRSSYTRDELGWWRCNECSHLPDEHYPEPFHDDPFGSYECSRCNCGNNSR